MPTDEKSITIVSGLPRSGTSLMMQLLAAGGIPALTDDIRKPDEDNPRGYFEFERVKQLKHDKTWLAEATGKVVKVVHLLLYELPPGHNYRVVFMRRHLNEILVSQQKMLQRAGRTGPAASTDLLAKNFNSQVAQVLQWLSAQRHFQVLEVWHHDLIARPQVQVSAINSFFGGGLHEAAMTRVVDPALHRNRSA